MNESMQEDYFPDDLDNWIQIHQSPPPASELLNRCLGTIPKEYFASATSSVEFWEYAALIAAVVLLWINLSMSAVQSTDFGYKSGESCTMVMGIESRNPNTPQ